MARVTIEDCLLYLPNRFQIVLRAAERARELSEGAKTTAAPISDSSKAPKCTVAALREIASGQLKTEEAKTDEDVMDALISELNKLDDDQHDLFDDTVV